MEKEEFTVSNLGKRGVFDVLQVTNRDFKNGYLYRKEVEKRSKEEKPEPFIFHALDGKNPAGTAASRIWIHIVGNVASCVAIPIWMCKNPIAIESFPTIASHAIKETANKYAPDSYIMKFPNDVVCKEHFRKTGGILVRKEGKFLLLVFGFNIVANPEKAQLRKEGIEACCLKNHFSGSEKLPDPLDFTVIAANQVFTIYERFNYFEKIEDFQKYLDWVNVELNIYAKKTFRAEINNPKADIYKDGYMWTRDHPNALQKGYLNGDEYESAPWLFDTKYYENADKNASTEKEMDRKTRELREFRAKEKAEKEKAEKEKAEAEKKKDN